MQCILQHCRARDEPITSDGRAVAEEQLYPRGDRLQRHGAESQHKMTETLKKPLENQGDDCRSGDVWEEGVLTACSTAFSLIALNIVPS